MFGNVQGRFDKPFRGTFTEYTILPNAWGFIIEGYLEEAGRFRRTSQVRSIDFVTGDIITLNSLYKLKIPPLKEIVDGQG